MRKDATAPWASPGYRLYVENVGPVPDPFVNDVENYLARLALAQNGRALGEGIRVEPPDGTLLELVQNGTPALVEEPRAA